MSAFFIIATHKNREYGEKLDLRLEAKTNAPSTATS
jgi:hypothetical protein